MARKSNKKMREKKKPKKGKIKPDNELPMKGLFAKKKKKGK